ncbi:MAG: hypothetical protein Q4C04_02490 [Clostridia bacterium]|nr:hypothetical protein [Clostridia bacterium]
MKRGVLTLTFILLGAALLAVGIVSQQPREVYNKARFICTECIGLG